MLTSAPKLSIARVRRFYNFASHFYIPNCLLKRYILPIANVVNVSNPLTLIYLVLHILAYCIASPLTFIIFDCYYITLQSDKQTTRFSKYPTVVSNFTSIKKQYRQHFSFASAIFNVIRSSDCFIRSSSDRMRGYSAGQSIYHHSTLHFSVFMLLDVRSTKIIKRSNVVLHKS